MSDTQAAKLVSSDHDEKLSQLISMGFEPVKSEQALEAGNFDVDSAIGYLLSGAAGDKAGPSKAAPDWKGKTDQQPSTVCHSRYQGQEEGAKASVKAPRHSGSNLHHIPWSNPNEEGLPHSRQQQRLLKSGKKSDWNMSEDCPLTGLETATAAGGGQGPTSAGISNPIQWPGAEAVSGIGVSPRPLQQVGGRRHSSNDTVLVSAQVVSDEEPGPLVLATPADEDRNRRREFRRLYVLGCSAVLLVLIGVGVAVALMLILGDRTSNTTVGVDAPSASPTKAPGDTSSLPTTPSPNIATTERPPTESPPTASPPTPDPTPPPTSDPMPLPPTESPPTERPPTEAPPTPDPSPPPTPDPTTHPEPDPTPQPTSDPTPLTNYQTEFYWEEDFGHVMSSPGASCDQCYEQACDIYCTDSNCGTSSAQENAENTTEEWIRNNEGGRIATCYGDNYQAISDTTCTRVNCSTGLSCEVECDTPVCRWELTCS